MSLMETNDSDYQLSSCPRPEKYSFAQKKCPTISHNMSKWPPQVAESLPECECVPPGSCAEGAPGIYKEMPCINTFKTGGSDSASSGEKGSRVMKLWDPCIHNSGLESEAPLCPYGSECIAQEAGNRPGYSYYSQCRPRCASQIISSCCNTSHGCEKCLDMPQGGNCKSSDSEHEFQSGSKWLKNELNDVCTFYSSGTKKYYFDNGNACNELICTENGGKWQSWDAPGVEYNKNIYRATKSEIIDASFMETGSYIEGMKLYSPTKNFNINRDCDEISSILTNDGYLYSLASSKPKNLHCVSFKEWNECSKQSCITNCNNNTKYSNCDELCEPVNLDDPNLTVKASTTDFGFGAATSCMCDGADLMNSLTNYNKSGKPYFVSGAEEGNGYWVGVATPSWIQSPFDTNTTSGIATGGSTIWSEYGNTYTSNCSIGKGGCGSCWKLTREDGPKQEINAVVIDTCEDKNAYGNNFNWCVAQRPDVCPSTYKTNPGATYSGHFPPFYNQLPRTETNTLNSYGEMQWTSEACFNNNGEFICKNMDFHPVHFDVATQDIPNSIAESMGMWKESTNPKVTAKRIKCPEALKRDILTKHCGNPGAKSHATPAQYCKGVTSKMCFSDSNLQGIWPESNCQNLPSPSPGPPPGPGPGPGPPPGPSRYACYYYKYGMYNQSALEQTTPASFCEGCCQKPGSSCGNTQGNYPDFGSFNDWNEVNWGNNSNMKDWLNAVSSGEESHTVYCHKPNPISNN